MMGLCGVSSSSSSFKGGSGGGSASIKNNKNNKKNKSNRRSSYELEKGCLYPLVVRGYSGKGSRGSNLNDDADGR